MLAMCLYANGRSAEQAAASVSWTRFPTASVQKHGQSVRRRGWFKPARWSALLSTASSLVDSHSTL
jgi:hypothetical protein